MTTQAYRDGFNSVLEKRAISDETLQSVLGAEGANSVKHPLGSLLRNAIRKASVPPTAGGGKLPRSGNI